MGVLSKPAWCVVPRPEAHRTFVSLALPGQAPREEDLSNKDQVILGRQADMPAPGENFVLLKGSHTSRRHAAVFFDVDGKAYLQDLGSSNGTFVNGQRLTSHKFVEWTPEDEVRFGDPPHHDNAKLRWIAPMRRAPKRPREEEVPSRNLQLPKARGMQPQSGAASAALPTEPAGAGAPSIEATNGRAQSSSQRPFIGPVPPASSAGPPPPAKSYAMQGPQLVPAQRARSLPAVPGRAAEAFANGAGQVARAAAKCDKCDGPHATDVCPHFKKPREEHKDAWVNYGAKRPQAMGSDGGNFVLRNAKTIKQPGDGSCLFHSLCYGLSRMGLGRFGRAEADMLRREIARFIADNPHLEISGDTLEEWIRWDANTTSANYARRMAVGGWGGGIEMAACSRLKNVSVHVYEPIRSSGGGFRRISCFNHPQARSTVHVLYQGGVHYDALLPAR